MLVREFMHVGVHTVRVDEPVASAARTMRDAEIGVLLVVDGSGARRGLVSRTDLLAHVVDHGIDGDIGSLVSRELLTVDAEDSLQAATRLMALEGVHHLVVLERGVAVGVLGAWDLARAAGIGRISLLEGPTRAIGVRSGPGV